MLPGDSGHSTSVLRTMFEARKRVFVDLLKWDVPVLDGRYEIDQFDTPDADYLILTDDYARHRASARLLRTDRAHILGALFPCLCDGPVPSGDRMREITRFCIEPKLARAERYQARNQLVTALVQHALASGIDSYTAVATRAWFRQIEDFGWKCRALGPFQKIGYETLVALHIEIDTNTAEGLEANGIFCPSSFKPAAAEQLQ
jgi:acyl homoserine lactone synthase/acyl-homoserine lactone synthase